MIAAVIVAYSLVGLITARMLAGHLAWKFCAEKRSRSRRPDGEEWFVAGLGALIAAVIWPATLLFISWPLKVGMERQEKDRLKREELEKHIATLERAAGLKEEE